MTDTLLKLQEAILGGDDVLTQELTQQALNEGIQPDSIFKEALAPTLQKVGQLWKEGKFYMSDSVISIEAFQSAKDLLMASQKDRVNYVGKVVIGTVAGNQHSLGKKMVIGMLEASRFEVIDLGENVPAFAFVDRVREEKPDILGLGCYTSNAVLSLEMVTECLKDSGLRDGIKVIIGGESTSQELADQLGLDAWAEDIIDTVEKVKTLIG